MLFELNEDRLLRRLDVDSVLKLADHIIHFAYYMEVVHLSKDLNSVLQACKLFFVEWNILQRETLRVVIEVVFFPGRCTGAFFFSIT